MQAHDTPTPVRANTPARKSPQDTPDVHSVTRWRRPKKKMQIYLYVFGGIALVIVMAFLFLQLGPSSGSLPRPMGPIQTSTEGQVLVPHHPSGPAPGAPSAPPQGDEFMVDVVPFGRRNL
jgi:hypothetical protein